MEIEEAERIFASARQPKAFYPLIAGDHLVTDRRVADEVLTVATRWFDRTLGAD